ncbi:MAG: hypothetical protein KTR16_00680 [Acidiferrobacterales bacterium]|nr:hypothetical protein [Acidiferrobacterales bacterium]
MRTTKPTFLFVAYACLLSFISQHANAAASSDNAEVLPSIIYLLHDSSDDHEYGSLIPGKLYSMAELAFWRNRAQTGPHVMRGDAYGTATTGSTPSYGIIDGNAEGFRTTSDSDIVLTGISRTDLINKGLTNEELDEITFSGDCAVLDPNNGNTRYDWYEFGRFDQARDAAFIDLLDNTTTHTARIKSLLLQQAQQPCIDFTNRDLFTNGPNITSFWLYLEWANKVLRAYDYLDESVFTTQEKTTIDDWFKGAAEWAYYYLTVRHLGDLYDYRAADPINSLINLPNPDNPNNTGYWQNRPAYASYRIRYEGSSIFWPGGSIINNRQLGQLNFVVMAGIKFDVEEWKREGAQTVKEYVSFHFDDNGYYAELNRSADSSSQAGMALGIPVKAEHGLSYGANSLVNIAEIAHILYLAGYDNLFEYRSKARINQASGEIEAGSVEKSLEWVLLKFRENFMLASSPAIYPLGLSTEQRNTDTVIHFCKNTHREKVGGNRVVGRMYMPAAIINRYYKNPMIKDIYNASESFGNLCGYVDTELEIRPGPHGILPGALFQYSDAKEDY